MNQGHLEEAAFPASPDREVTLLPVYPRPGLRPLDVAHKAAHVVIPPPPHWFQVTRASQVCRVVRVFPDFRVTPS